MMKARIAKLRPSTSGDRRYLYRAHVITRCVRDWSARGLGWAGPIVSWEVHGVTHSGSWTFGRRRDAVAWIDEHLDGSR